MTGTSPNTLKARLTKPQREQKLIALGTAGYSAETIAAITGYGASSVKTKLTQLGAQYHGLRANKKRGPVPFMKLDEYRALRRELPELTIEETAKLVGLQPLPDPEEFLSYGRKKETA